ncbi:hypothetical protein GCM10009663_56290 [Kitasatospora arboriphila]|uniref:Secreted protein n=1 Tax=Kitasatospora arboriphila TaxID=258052 RepID=A0ABN1TX63_9ACTN
MAHPLVRRVLGFLVLIAPWHLDLEAEVLVLRPENEMPRQQLARPRYEPADGAGAAGGALERLPRHRRTQVFPLTPATLPPRHRRPVGKKCTHEPRRRAGGPPPLRYAPRLFRAGLFERRSGNGIRSHVAPFVQPIGATSDQDWRAARG